MTLLRNRTTAIIRLFVAAIAMMSIVHAQEAAPETSPRPSPHVGWTVDRLAIGVLDAMRRFDTVLLEATYTQKRDTNALSGKSPVVITGTGSLTYRADQDRWFMRDDGYSFRRGTTEIRPRVSITGYDGQIHYTGDQRRLHFGEEGFRTAARPKSLIWETMLTYPYIERALDKSTAEITSTKQRDGIEVVTLEASWGKAPNEWKLIVEFAPEKSFLALSQKLWLNNKLYADSSLDRIVRVQDSTDWRPTTIATTFHQEALGIIEEHHQIDRFLLPDSFEDDQFRFEPLLDSDVVDRRTNLGWHVDPWWSELSTWMGSELDWPRHRFSSLGEFRSYVDDSIDMSTAPPIEAQYWLRKDARGRWDREDRGFTVLFFTGDASRLIDPNPRWITELGQFTQLVEPIGGEVIGIATPDTKPESLERSARELMIEFPFAIDEADGSSTGKTHQAYKLQHYYSVLVVDTQGKVHVVGEGDSGLVPTVRRLLTEQDAMWLDEQLQRNSELSRADHDAIREKWIQMRRQTTGRGTITGVATAAAGSVMLTPQFKMLIGNNPGGYMLVADHGGGMNAKVDPETGIYTFTGLPRGRYELKFQAIGSPDQSADVILKDNNDSAVQDFD